MSFLNFACVLTGGENLQIVCCTACGRQVNHFKRDSLFQHPMLKVLICRVSLPTHQSLFLTTMNSVRIYKRKCPSKTLNGIWTVLALLPPVSSLHPSLCLSCHLSNHFLSPATNITKVMTSARMEMEWMSNAGIFLSTLSGISAFLL